MAFRALLESLHLHLLSCSFTITTFPPGMASLLFQLCNLTQMPALPWQFFQSSLEWLSFPNTQSTLSLSNRTYCNMPRGRNIYESVYFLLQETFSFEVKTTFVALTGNFHVGAFYALAGLNILWRHGSSVRGCIYMGAQWGSLWADWGCQS